MFYSPSPFHTPSPCWVVTLILVRRLGCLQPQHLFLSQYQRISVACAPMKRALASREAASTASSPSSCARAVISQTTMAQEASPSMERSLMMKTSFSNTQDQVSANSGVVREGGARAGCDSQDGLWLASHWRKACWGELLASSLCSSHPSFCPPVRVPAS